MINSLQKAIGISMAFFLLTGTCLAAASKQEPNDRPPDHSIYFSLADQHGFPLTTPAEIFDCSDKIYTVVDLSRYPLGKHELSILWIDPADSSREHTQYAFHVRENETRLWAWLSLSRAQGAAMLQWLNPAAGLEEFIGPWTVEVRIDNRKIASKNFEVSC
ncbi:MAG: hypothetical protein HKN85_08220 [Gammaproteobacteria bacterium]|nr:hypothetical protein [Gammaproteobacteria bacterium]